MYKNVRNYISHEARLACDLTRNFNSEVNTYNFNSYLITVL